MTDTALAVAEPAAHPHPVVAPVASSMPTPAEWQMLAHMADALAASDLVPAAYRRKPANVLLASLAGRPFGWDPTMAMRSFHIIEGTPSLKPEIMLALIRQAGHSVSGETSDLGATVTGVRRDTGDTMTFSFTIDDAKRAGLASKSVWKSYPASMCWARALSQLARMLFPDVVLGAGYTPEELGATVNGDGDVIDVVDIPQASLSLPVPPGPVTARQVQRIKILQRECGIDDSDYRARLAALFDGVTSSKDLDEAQAGKLILKLEARLDQVRAAAAAADDDEVADGEVVADGEPDPFDVGDDVTPADPVAAALADPDMATTAPRAADRPPRGRSEVSESIDKVAAGTETGQEVEG